MKKGRRERGFPLAIKTTERRKEERREGERVGVPKMAPHSEVVTRRRWEEGGREEEKEGGREREKEKENTDTRATAG